MQRNNNKFAFGNAKKFNKYNLSSFEYGVGYTLQGDIFYFDLEDYEKIKDICWHKDSSTGYIKGYNNINNSKKVFLHRVIMEANKGDIIDHINHNLSDNRKVNLRRCTRSQNGANTKRRIDNKSGHSGVYYDKSRNKWSVQISVNNKKIFIGRYNFYDDAVNARKNAENKYFKEFSYDNSINEIESVGDYYEN